jgi:hypothetical protein
MLQEMRPERADADPRAGGQFKVLREASVVTKAGLLISGFRPGQRIAGSQKSVFVECIDSLTSAVTMAQNVADLLARVTVSPTSLISPSSETD